MTSLLVELRSVRTWKCQETWLRDISLVPCKLPVREAAGQVEHPEAIVVFAIQELGALQSHEFSWASDFSAGIGGLPFANR